MEPSEMSKASGLSSRSERAPRLTDDVRAKLVELYGGINDSMYPLLDRIDAYALSERPLKMAYATPEAYAAVNPMGGPAVIFEAMAKRIRAGEDFYEVLDDYGLQSKFDERSDKLDAVKAEVKRLADRARQYAIHGQQLTGAFGGKDYQWGIEIADLLESLAAVPEIQPLTGDTPRTAAFSNPSTEGEDDLFVSVGDYNELLESHAKFERELAEAKRMHAEAIEEWAKWEGDCKRLSAPLSASGALDALRELVTLKNLKDALDGIEAVSELGAELHQQRLADYQRRKPLAWERARAVIAGTVSTTGRSE